MAMIQLFNGMQSSLSMVYDREMGNMRTLAGEPAAALVSPVLQAAGGNRGLAAAGLCLPPDRLVLGHRPAADRLSHRAAGADPVRTMLGALGMLISSGIKQLENFAGVMNFVIFPMFFASSALYPLWRVQEGSPLLYYVCLFNPFTHAVELIRFALYGQIELDFACRRRRLHGGLHDRRDPGL